MESLHLFFDWLNEQLPGIKFTMKHSTEGIEFLDNYIYTGENNMLLSKPYSKECDDHAFLVPSSCHATHTLRNIPYSVGHRIYKISSENCQYQEAKITS